MKKVLLRRKLIEKIKLNKCRTIVIIDTQENIRINDQVILCSDENSVFDDNACIVILDMIKEVRLHSIDQSDIDLCQYDSIDALNKDISERYGNTINTDIPVKVVSFTIASSNINIQSEDITLPEKIQLFADGGSRGNPGPSASGYVLLDQKGNVLKNGGIFLGVTTNNQAEYKALMYGLEDALKHGVKEVDVYMDSLLAINQVNGIFKIRNQELLPIYQAIKKLELQFDRVTFSHVPRERNKLADAQVNIVLDQEASSRSV
ncbi:MAG: hypothetical protein NVSMB46_01160 [Candidatus Saccharimonadales bacterium]